MPTTARGIVYPGSGEHTRLWEHFQALADSVEAELSSAPLIRVRRDTTQSLTSGSSTLMSFDTVDTNLGFTFTTGTAVPIPEAGTYRINAGAAASVGATAQLMLTTINKNGAPWRAIGRGSGSPSAPTVQTGSTEAVFAAGDTVGLTIFHNGGAGITSWGGTLYGTFLEIARVR